jgi:hypothetical protein
MLKKIVCGLSAVIFCICLSPGVSFAKANDLDSLFKQVEKLKIERNGYVLGADLNRKQMKIAKANPVEAASPDTFKFKDDNLFVVAQKSTDRVLVIYEQVENASQKDIQGMVGDLYMQFDDPTLLAHDKIIYWAFGEKGKISTETYNKVKSDQKKLNVLATVKLVSDIKITEKSKEPVEGPVYYIISSAPILEFFGEPKK